MAEMLKQQYGLTALKLWLDTGRYKDAPIVRFELQGKTGRSLETLHEWSCYAKEIGLPYRLDRRSAEGEGPYFSLPKRLIHELGEAIWDLTERREPLWLHLVKPYGYLGIVPWEKLLHLEGLSNPVLRLPDFIVPPPRETRRALDVVLCISTPVSERNFPAVQYLEVVSRQILRAAKRKVRLHIFMDKRWRHFGHGADLGPDVRFYDAEKAADYSVPRATSNIRDQDERVENPWLLWMRDALEGQSVDVVHFLCHGYFANDRGAIAVSESPVLNKDKEYARYIGPAELTTFLTQLGAWAVGFTCIPNNYSRVGLRALADTIGQLRPGSVLHHNLADDPHAKALGEAYRFLFSPEPEEPFVVPGDLFMYCQPHRVRGAMGAPTLISDFDLGLPPESPDISDIFEHEERVPSWLAASQRFLEQAKLDLERDRQGKRSSSRGAASQRNSEDTVRQIQDIIAKTAKFSKLERKS